MSKLFDQIQIKDMNIKNRIVMPPMCMYCAKEDGKVTNFHKLHYGARAIGGVGLIIVEATAVRPDGRISGEDLGLWEDTQIQGMKDLVALVHENGSKIGIQLNHAGRKSKGHKEQIIAPSAIAFEQGDPVPKEMNKEEIKDIVKCFQQAALRAMDAGFDIIELHAAHGYLLNEFLSPLTNLRTDEYGGDFKNRVRILSEVLEATRKVWPMEKPLMVRVTAQDYGEGGNMPQDLAEMLNLIKHHGIDLVNVSTGGVISIAPKAFPGYQIPHAKLIKKEVGLPVVGGGLITTASLANEILEKEDADLVYVGRELLRNPHFSLMAAKECNQEISWPKQYERAKK